MTHSKKAILSVTNDLVTDKRVHKMAKSLYSKGFKVTLVGRRLKHSQPIHDPNFSIKRFNLLFNRGAFFYTNYNIRLFFFLLFNKSDLLFANDLDTLAPNYLVSKIKGVKLIYDSHELFTEVPELVDRPRVKKVWEQIEAAILPKLDNTVTVSGKIADFYNQKYGIQMKLIRNFPELEEDSITSQKAKENIIIYQGALNIHRGLEELIDAMKFVDDAVLWIAGKGDIEKSLKEKVKVLNIEQKVKFFGAIPFNELKEVTKQAKIGVSLEKKIGLNYTYALPNKVFDYIHAKVPVLYSDLAEVKTTLKDFEIGEQLRSYKAEEMAEQIQLMLNSEKQRHWVAECSRAAKSFNWQKEEEKLFDLL